MLKGYNDNTLISDSPLSGRASNSLTRPQSTASYVMEQLVSQDTGMASLAAERATGADDLEIAADVPTPGDLVEMR